MRRTILAGIVVVVALAAATGGFAAQKYLIISARQIKPGAIAYRNLNNRTRKLIARTGERGPRGFPGAAANALAQASGLVAWTSDPALISTSIADSSGSIHGGSVWLDRGNRIVWLAELMASGGSGVTHGAYAIYDSHLHLVARTVDHPSSFQTGSKATWVKLPLTSPYTVPASGLYYFADLVAGARPPRIAVAVRALPLSVRNLLPNGVPRAIKGGSGFSAFPARLTNMGTGLTRSIAAG
jgi:hypothetical protein